MALIELEDVEVHYGGFKALDKVSCTVTGGAVGLLGPNGAGKSTLMKTLLGFNRASAGKVRVFGKDMPAQALEIRQLLGYMPEREVVSPKASAVSFLSYCGEIMGMSRVDAMERSHEVLNYVGLGESRYRKMETYSTGMLQRVKLAQAIVHDPKLLLLDEPTNGLDPDSRIEMLELIRDIAKNRQVTILLSSHLLPDVQYVCEQVFIISRGKILQQGAINDLTAQLERSFEVRVRDSKPAFLTSLDQRAIPWQELPNGDLQIHLPDELPEKVLFTIAQELGTQIRHFQPARQRLEEVFMHALEQQA
jgi:ABC-2 type transport system ATP-binding protein